MKFYMQTKVAVGILSLLLLFSACRDSNSEPTQQYDKSAISLSLPTQSESRERAVSTMGDAFFVKVNSPSSWVIKVFPEEAKAWLHLEQSEGNTAQDLGLSIKVLPNKGEQRVATLTLFTLGQETAPIRVVQQGKTTQVTPPTNGGGEDSGGDHTPPNGGTIAQGEHIFGNPSLLEVPRLMGGSNMYFVTFNTSDNKPNYSVEYDVDKRHARWVAYSWDEHTARDVTSRSDAWAWDPIIPERYSTDQMFRGSGFSRGHLVASNDRQYSVEANRQTFYYCNMSPQRQEHNGGVWLQLEDLLQKWARTDDLKYDALYVAKGGTIADGQIEDTRVAGKIVVPKYYWVAVLMKRGNEYFSIGFWTEHLKPQRVNNIKILTRSIDELEALTGIDLFANLDDAIEVEVEKQKADAFAWPRI